MWQKTKIFKLTFTMDLLRESTRPVTTPASVAAASKVCNKSVNASFIPSADSSISQ